MRRRGDTLSAQALEPQALSPARRAHSPRYYPAQSRNEVAIVQLVLVKQLENDATTAVTFRPRWPLTGTTAGVKMWISIFPAMSRKNGHESRAATDAQDLDWIS